MTMVEPNIELPAAYRLITLDNVNNLRDYAKDLAREGAEEGTIVIARQQENAIGCGDKPWQSLQGNLHSSIILRPDFAKDEYHQILFIGVVSLGNAIAQHVSPMTSLNYSWPNDINIANHKIASVWIDSDQSPDEPWLNITCSVNVMQSPEELQMSAISLREAEGNADITASNILETWSRQFINEINTWAERGFTHILNFWKTRSEIVDATVAIQLDDKMINGRCAGINNNGDLLIDQSNGNQTVITVNQYMHP